MGALGISGVPLWNGYISKTLLHEAIVECMHLGGSPLAYEIVEVLFLLAGGMTFAYMTKLYVCLFLEKHPTDQEKHDSRNGHYMGKLATVALVLAALVPPVLGMRPHETLDKIADYGQTIMTHLTMDHAVHYFDPHVMKGAFVSIGFGVLMYFLLVRKVFMKKNGDGVMEYVYRWPQWLDLEYLVVPAVSVYHHRISADRLLLYAGSAADHAGTAEIEGGVPMDEEPGEKETGKEGRELEKGNEKAHERQQ